MPLREVYNVQTFFPPCHPGEVEYVTAKAELSDDISDVFPYLNAIMKGTLYDSKNNILNFKLAGHGITLYSKNVVITRLKDEEEAHKFLGHLKYLINKTYERKHRIEPSYKSREQLTALQLYKLLPGTNCRACGEPTCMGFAAKLINEETSIEKCAPLFTEKFSKKKEKLMHLLEDAGHHTPRVSW